MTDHKVTADETRATDLLAALCSGIPDTRFVLIPGAPPSKSRPQFGRGRTYTPKAARAAEARTAVYLRRISRYPHTGNVALACIFYRPNRQRIDADNLLKHVCDAANGILWVDDSQVTAIVATVEYDPDAPRTLVAFAPHVTSMTRGTDATRPCEHCGGPITIPGTNTGRRFCSQACNYQAKTTTLPALHCKQCSTSFHPFTRGQTLCSPECRAAWLRDRPRPQAKPRSVCTECSKELTHTRGGRCRDCWRADPGTYGGKSA